ncbi:DUF2868 domain-containing protein [Eleftheria terrae]|uniref:DUF2868 domain-containing protein n=1 Tax=Eleftheria terrae TaxID=1597781 RepID=UPI00263AE2C6|nr:DUF2868 domain-containing protein [Eleftheria terrae]WKB53705.1 DUF2868 domain-containing protein [Eleftheria terrae]
MTESDARLLLLTRAFEDPPTTPWTDADAAWATQEALHVVGEAADAERLLACRAGLAVRRLQERGAVPATALAAHPLRGWGLLLVAAAFLLGMAGNAAGASGHINLLAPPLLALLVWNLLVYLALVVAAVRPGRTAPGPLRRALGGLADGAMRRLQRPGAAPALARFAAAWLHAARPLQAARGAALLHAAAAALALGAVASLYLRGLAFEYRASWDSTFLVPETVHALLRAVLAPAAWLGGIELPGPAELAALRASSGGSENAARWIHLQALTLGWAVLLPRLVLAALAARKATRFARRFPLPLQDAYFQGLLRQQRRQPLAVQVLPYSYHMPDALLPGLQAVLQQALGGPVAAALAPAVPLGGEDDPVRWLPALPAGGARVLLFALTATPERENHGALLRLLLQRGEVPVRVVIDESGFRQRFGADAQRLAQRRSAWQALLQDSGQAALFVDLSQAMVEPRP